MWSRWAISFNETHFKQKMKFWMIAKVSGLSLVVVILIAQVGCNRTSPSKTTVSVTTPAESVTTNGPSDAPDSGRSAPSDLDEFALEVYPGLELTTEAGSNTNVETSTMRSASVTGSTTDSVEKVVAFYEPQLKDVQTTKNDDGAFLTGKSDNGSVVLVVATKKDSRTEILITATFKK